MNLNWNVFLLSLISVFYQGQIINVGEQTISYTDNTRERLVKTQVWYPTTDKDVKNTELPFLLPPTVRNATFVNKKHPLIVLSHVTGGNRLSLSWLAIELAKKGYIVIAPDHWGNTLDNKIPEYFVRYWERPLDMSFLLSSFLQDKRFNHYVDNSRIGTIGFSLGGYTSLALAGIQLDCELLKLNVSSEQGRQEFTVPELGDLRNLVNNISCLEVPANLRDSRFKVHIALAPALGLGLPQWRQNITSPVLIIGANDDKIAPIETNGIKYSTAIPSSRFVKLAGKTGHYIFLNEGNPLLQKEESTYYQDDQTIDRRIMHQQILAQILDYLTGHLR
ncbi:putative dienelactone hydrolase [Chryseobacterium sp. H1D6B]|uniref:alpha/beta hydrolase family protein n=1 Tax=Chryseobacterium sp. H1D6B TaxID=2940588 RepID=UPI0015CBF09F|nr:dienelactone hydrolase family protein [Chryseobacterium sp. H1D6B]MDH6252407.1 putative dienelactone hydrolase [Chryseobacterium sp. H1D6B]